MPSIKSPCLAILALSLVFSTLPIRVHAQAPTDAAKRAVPHHVDLVVTDDSCDDAPERVLLAGSLVDPRAAFVANPDGMDDDEDQGDQLGSAPILVDSDVILRHDPPQSESLTVFDVVVRGKKTLLAVFSRAGPAVGPSTPEEEPLEASLRLQGFRIAAKGPRFEVGSGRRAVGPFAPPATPRHPSRGFSAPFPVAPAALHETDPGAAPFLAAVSAAAPEAR